MQIFVAFLRAVLPKTMLLILLLTQGVLPQNPIPADDPRPPCEVGKRDAKLKVNATKWLLLGMVTGPFALFMVSPEGEVPSARLVSQTPDYIAKYIQCYEDETIAAKKRYALSGCVITTAGAIIGAAVIAGKIGTNNSERGIPTISLFTELESARRYSPSRASLHYAAEFSWSNPLEQLTSNGFTISGQFMQGDTLVIDWAHPDFADDGDSQVRYREVNDQPLSTEIRVGQASWLLSDYESVKDTTIPTRIEVNDPDLSTNPTITLIVETSTNSNLLTQMATDLPR